VEALEYWTNNPPCPSCTPNYRYWFPTDILNFFDGYKSNTFTFNMLMQNPAGPIIPPPMPAAPGYHEVPGNWYPTRQV